MKTWYTTQKEHVHSPLCNRLIGLLLFVMASFVANAQQELVFKNSVLQSGNPGDDGTVYRFPLVTANIDALVKINNRSSHKVTLESIDLTNTGFSKSFQPQVTYNNGNANAQADWWMEFQISFVQTNTNNLVAVNGFDVTGIDIDGNDDKLNEYVTFYKQQSYTTENNTLLSITSVSDNISGQVMNGKKISGPVTNYDDIDTTATRVMITNKYLSTNSFIIRTGAKTTGSTGATDRMYSFWFKGFTYQSPVQAFLPVTLIDWSATYNNTVVSLQWKTTVEQNSSQFIVEKSLDGVEYKEAGSIKAAGFSEVIRSYTYNDAVSSDMKGMVYYRLRMVDVDGKFKISDVKSVRIRSNDLAKMTVYPNPVTNQLHIDIPVQWQNQPVTYSLMTSNGQIITTLSRLKASQSETLHVVGNIPPGLLILKVSHGLEMQVQTLIKSTR